LVTTAKSVTLAFVVALVNVTAVPFAAPVVQPLKVPLQAPLVTVLPVRPFDRLAKAPATAPAKIEPLAVKVSPPILIDSPATKSLNVATLLSVAAAAAPSVFTTVGLAARVPVLGKSVTSELALADVNVSVDPEVIADVVQPVKVPEYAPLAVPGPVVALFARLANAAATLAAETVVLAVKVNPPIVTVCPLVRPANVTEFDSVVAPDAPLVIAKLAPSVPPTIFPEAIFVKVIPEPVPPMLPFVGMVIVSPATYPVPLSVILIEPNVPSAAIVTVAKAPVPEPLVPSATFLYMPGEYPVPTVVIATDLMPLIFSTPPLT
jgi:hypothetical protein